MVRNVKTFCADSAGFAEAMDHINEFLIDRKIRKNRNKAMLIVEELLGSLLDHNRGDYLRVSTRSMLGTITLELSVEGEPYSLTENIKTGMFRCMSNCLGDVAVTSIVAKSEKMIDMDVYRR